MEILLSGLLIGVDNLAVCLALGILPFALTRRLLLLSAFVLAETLMPVIGLGLNSQLTAFLGKLEWLEPLSLLGTSLLVFLAVYYRHNISELCKNNHAFFLLPLSLSLDNLLAGFGSGGNGMAQVLTMGLISALLCSVGLGAGYAVNRRFALSPQKSAVFSASGIAVLAVASIVGEFNLVA